MNSLKDYLNLQYSNFRDSGNFEFRKYLANFVIFSLE